MMETEKLMAQFSPSLNDDESLKINQLLATERNKAQNYEQA